MGKLDEQRLQLRSESRLSSHFKIGALTHPSEYECVVVTCLVVEKCSKKALWVLRVEKVFKYQSKR